MGKIKKKKASLHSRDASAAAKAAAKAEAANSSEQAKQGQSSEPKPAVGLQPNGIIVEEALYCPITCDLFSDPVNGPDGYTYERAAIAQWLEKHGTSPFTRAKMRIDELQSNDGLKAAVAKFIKQNQKSLADTSKASKEAICLIANETVASSLRTVRHEATVALDPLADVAESINFQRPQIIVIGTESHGKSTIMDRLAGMPIFPRDEELCTRIPIRVRLRRGPIQCIRMWEQNVNSNGQHIGNPKSLMSNAEMVPGVNLLTRVHQTMKDIMQKLDDELGARTVSLNKEIVIQLTGPSYPELDLVDLPGLVETPRQHEDQSMPDNTRALSQRYLRQHGENSMFIVALDSRHPMHTSTAVKLLREENVADKTLGVLTMCDAFFPLTSRKPEGNQTAIGEGLTKLLSDQNRNYVPTGYGWILLSSRDLPMRQSPAYAESVSATKSKDIKAEQLLISLSECEAKEAAFFKEHGVSAEHAGIATLCKTIVRSFENYLHCTWVPEAIRRLRQAACNTLPQIKELGVPFYAGAEIDQLGSAGKYAVPEEELLAQLQNRLVTLVAHKERGVWAAATNWLREEMKPLMEALAALRSHHATKSSGGDVYEDVKFFSGGQEAEKHVQHVAKEVVTLFRAAAESDTHPAAKSLEEFLAQDDTTLKLSRFRFAVEAVVFSASELLKAWSQACAETITYIADASAAVSSHGGAAASLFGGPTDDKASPAKQAVQTLVRQQVALSLELPLLCARACQYQLYNCVGDLRSFVAECVKHKQLEDFSDEKRADLLFRQSKLAQAERELRKYHPRGPTEKQFAKELNNSGLDSAVMDSLRNIFNSSCKGTFKLSGTSFNGNGVNVLKMAIQTNQSLKELNLSQCSLGHQGLQLLSDTISRHNVIEKLKLSNNQLGSNQEAMRKFREALEVNGTLLHLDLSNNDVNGSDTAELQAALEVNSSLKELILDNNRIQDDGARCLGKALEKNTGLEKLSLTANGISCSGVQDLANAMESNISLKELSLRQNEIGDNAARSLADKLQKNGTLETLDLYSCELSDEGAKCFVETLKSNATLKKINFESNSIQDQVQKELRNAAQEGMELLF